MAITIWKTTSRRKGNNALNIFNRRKNELISSFSNELVEYVSNNEDFCKEDMNKEY